MQNLRVSNSIKKWENILKYHVLIVYNLISLVLDYLNSCYDTVTLTQLHTLKSDN